VPGGRVFMLMLFSGVQDKAKEIANLNQQLGLLDLKVVPVTADGNCFFRYGYHGKGFCLYLELF